MRGLSGQQKRFYSPFYMDDKEKKRKKNREYYLRRKERGVCTKCGKRTPAEGRTVCEYCLNKDKEDYYWLKEHGICTKCGQWDAVPGKTMCEVCLDNQKVQNERRHEIRIKQTKETIEKRRRDGLCPYCGGKPSPGHVMCYECQQKTKKRYHKNKKLSGMSRSERPSYGLCYCCGNKLDTDKKLCSKCYETHTTNLPKVRKRNEQWAREDRLHYEQWKWKRRNQGQG